MSRPEFPRCVLPVQCITRIVAEQKAYDADPEGYERRQREREEYRRMEQEQEYQYHLQQQEQQEF